MLIYSTWPQGLPCASGGNNLAPKPVIDNGCPPELNNFADEQQPRGNWWEHDVYISALGSDARIASHIRHRDRARYLERVVFVLIDVRIEHVEYEEVCHPDGFIMKHEVWRGSSFKVGRC